MTSSRLILVPVDFSPHSEAALIWAARAADCLEAPLLVLHVVHDPESEPGYYARADSSKYVRSMEEIARELLREFLQRVQAENPESPALSNADSRLVIGVPAERILEVAEKEGSQLIVMGSQGRTGLSYLLLGSKAARVVKLSPIPVTIVKASGPEA